MQEFTPCREIVCEYAFVQSALLSDSHAIVRTNWKMDVLSKLWLYVFGYLNESELVFAAQVCFEWWKIIFRGPFMKDVELPEEIDLSG